MRKDKDGENAGLERRDFLKLTTAATAGFFAHSVLPDAARALPDLPANPVTPDALPTRNLGRTGYRVGLFSLGGQAAIEQPGTKTSPSPSSSAPSISASTTSIPRRCTARDSASAPSGRS